MKKSGLVSLLGAGLLVGCGGAGPAAAPSISVAVLAPSMPQTVSAGQTLSISATVANDPQNAGVTWTVTCSAPSCGSVNPSRTPSGMPTTYTAPSPVTAKLTVTVTATSATDNTKSVSLTVTVTSSSAIVVTLSPNTPQTLREGQKLSITASVTNDPQNAGVTWACSPSPCGSFNPADTPSGTPTIYTAPTSVTATLAITVTATSVTDNTKSASLTVTVIPPISVTLSPSTPQTVAEGQTLSITATVANDPANGGVNWTTTCSATACGTVSPRSTPSGTATTYAPPAPVTANLTVTVTATSLTDITKSASLTVTVTPNNNAALFGDFAILFTGFNAHGEIALVARFTADGKGGLSNGLLDSNTAGGSAMTTFTGTYTVGADNRGTLTANLANPPGSALFSRFVLETTVSDETRIGRIIEFDDSTGTGARGSGEIHKQDLTAAAFSVLADDYALGFSGDFGSTIGRFSVVGRFTLGTDGAFRAGQLDASVPGSSFSSPLTGALSAPDAATGRGAGIGTITVPSQPANLTMHIAYYVVAKNRMFVVVTDQRSATSPLLSGEVHRQQQATFTAASLTGPIVFGVVGTCVTPTSNSPAEASVTLGLLQADGMGVLTSGTFDRNDCGTINSTMSITGAYAVDSAVKGRVTITLSNSANSLVLYLRDNNKGYLLEGTSASPGSEVTFGTISPQVAPAAGFTEASLAGTYAAGTVEPSTSNVPNESGVVTLTSASGSQSTLSGILDISQASTPFLIPGATFAGTYTTTAVPGRFTATATSMSLTPSSFVIYAIAPGAFGMIDVTPGNIASSILFFEQ